MPHKKILSLLVIVVLAFLLGPTLLGEVPEEHWYSQNALTYFILFSVFILFSAAGYWVNRKKNFGKKMVKWHVWTTTIGIVLLIFGLFGTYHLDARTFENNLEASIFQEGKIKLLALIFLSSALLVIGFCVYLLNLIISNYSTDSNESRN